MHSSFPPATWEETVLDRGTPVRAYEVDHATGSGGALGHQGLVAGAGHARGPLRSRVAARDPIQISVAIATTKKLGGRSTIAESTRPSHTETSAKEVPAGRLEVVRVDRRGVHDRGHVGAVSGQRADDVAPLAHRDDDVHHLARAAGRVAGAGGRPVVGVGIGGTGGQREDGEGGGRGGEGASGQGAGGQGASGQDGAAAVLERTPESR